MTAGAAITLLALGGLLVAERRGSGLRLLWKPLASAGFLVVALDGGFPPESYGRLLFAGLVCSFVGDVALLGSSQRSFLAGLATFLAAHVLYASAFAGLGQSFLWLVIAGAGLAAIFALVARWLLPHVTGRMRGPVLAYMIAISAMVALSLGSVGQGAAARVALGATLFFLSDLAVARQEFVAESYVNRLWGLPAYYVAQLILATTI